MKLFNIDEVIKQTCNTMNEHRVKARITSEQLSTAYVIASTNPPYTYEGLWENEFVINSLKTKIFRKLFGSEFDMGELLDSLRMKLITETLNHEKHNSGKCVFQKHTYETSDGLCDIHQTFFVSYDYNEDNMIDEYSICVCEINSELWCFGTVVIEDWEKQFPTLYKDLLEFEKVNERN